MSEVTDLDANNLCTTEDAFESFQAVSMYQEDEYITLSDLVSPEPVAPDLTSEINEIPYDNEVVLNSNAEVLGEVSTTLDPVIEETIQATVEPSDLSTVSKVNIENPVDTSNENCLNSNEKPLNGKQRGRKKKILYGGTSELGSNFSGSFDTFLKITKSGARENSIPKPNLIVDSDRNRSKRIKSDSLLEENSAVRDEKAPVKHVVSKFGRTIKLKTNIDSTQDFDYETKKVSKRRGRQKKEAVDIQPPHDVDPTNLSNSLVSSEVSQSENDGIDDLPLGTPRVKRRGRPKKDLRNDQSHDVTFGTLGDEDKKQDCSRKYLGNDEIDDIPLGTLSHGAKEQSGTRKDTGNGENDDTSLIILNDGVKRRHRTRKDSGTDEMSLSSLSHRVKKRGRPRKESVTDDIALSTLSDEVNKGSRSKQDSDSDEIDEISLSMLGKRVKKQGKARKEITSLNKFANNPATSSVVKNLETDVNDDITLNNLNVKAKRGRKKRISSVTSSLLEKSSIGNTTEDFINKDEEDFNNTNITLSGVLENQIDNTNEQLNDNILTEIKKSPGKRGRKPKKQFIDAPSEDAEVKISPNEENNEDITDDVCLSQLKKCETNKTSTETDDIDIKVDTNKTNNETNDIDIKVDTNKTSNETDDIGITVDTNKTSNETDDIGIKIDTDKPQSTSLDVDSMDLKCGDITNKRHSKMPKMSDFEYNLDSIVVKDGETLNDSQDDDINNLLIEDPSKRPTRRKVKTALHYDEGSDEDPFANVELSDDDEPRRRKGTKYYSDDEYIPDAKIDKLGFGIAAEESSDSDIDESLDELIMQRKRRSPKKGNSQGPSKRIKKADITTDTPKADTSADGDIEGSLQSSVIKSTDSAESEPLRNWGMSNEFENFIAKKIQGTNLKIKKVSSTASTESSLAPLKIPTINTNEQKKTIEMCTQTKSIYSESVAVQTSVPCDMPMKENLPLTPEQSEKACEFLNSIVKTTAELGQLMTEKSEDFIKKKINTTHVVDTFKMDYCVKKSFLLFKLAKHNLMQMEEDLSKQYDEFLKSNDLLACREQIKEVKPKPPTDSKATSDSDCEIVGESTPGPAPKKRQEKPKFNPKTVFLNKELSIKIAKKPTDDKKLNIKGRHTVWINDSVMVKKVKPTQSFLAQDSRNKKPPDNFILAKMVSDFFRNYNREKIVSMCAPFTSAEWLHVSRNYVCNYFVVTPSELTGDTNYQQNNSHYVNDTTENNNIISQPNCSHIFSKGNINNMRTPKSLISLCTHALQNHLKMVNFDVKEARYDDSNQLTDEKNSKIKPVTLFRLCVGVLNEGEMDTIKVFPSIESPPNVLTVMSLKTLCYRRTIELFYMNSLISDSSKRVNDTIYDNKGINLKVNEQHDHTSSVMYANQSKIKSLFTICVEFLQKEQEIDTRCINIEDHIIQKTIYTASSLKHIAFVNIRNKLYKNEAMTAKSIGEHSTDMPKPDSNAKIDINAKESSVTVEGLTINCINTLSEEAFQNLDESVLNIQDNSQYLDDNSNYDEEFDTDYNNFEDDQTEGDNWVSQVQMQELRSCFTPNNEPPSHENNIFDEEPAGSPDIARVKIEPLDEMPDTMVDATVIKTEPENNLDEMTIIPDSIITKSEILDQPANAKVIERQNSNSYDVDSFESFVSSNKMMRSLSENGDEIFSQSGLRVRRQHEPDYAQEYDAGMSLLIPQTYATLNIENAKGDLMESSSDDATCDPKLKGKKKLDKRRGKQKKTEPKSKPKEVVTKTKDKLAVDTEVAVLTRRMREKIRQEEKMVESSDSEDENMTLNLRKEKDKKENTDKSKPSKSTKKSEDEIQCSNVDSTEQVNDNTNNSNTPVEKDKFTGFSAIDQNEISSYQKYMKYVYDKIIPKEDEKKENNERAVPIENNMEFNNERSQSPLIDFTEPAELLECEPTMPIFDDVAVRPKGKKKDIGDKNKEKQSSNIANDNEKQYTERHGWKCYHMDGNDPKLYQNAYIPLEKLPEDFVDTYLMYQDITDRDKEDEEVNRLINLNSLNRANIKDLATRSRNKIKNTDGEPSAHGSESNSRAASPAYSDHYAELTPSEDEGANVDDELPPAPRRQTAENSLAKNLLMNDNESDSDSSPKKIKEEITDENNTSKVYKPGPKSKRKHAETEAKDSDNLMLTADKMMNKELTLLHAPIVLKTEVPETPAKGPSTRHKQKSATKTPPTRDNTKADNSEESEEEKREKWVNTKEKLLKRVQRKEDASIEDAKRAKLVSEFIERRGDAPELQNRNRGRGRRSRKKFLERQKQLGVLSKELYGETSDSIGVSGKRSTAAAVFKGRRNIRKVIDKKSLARSTVLANMEEFERKRRLSMRQSRLTELLGCEEGVNVLVINDEVCLEYDFDENRPIVTVHPFFTKVMKAHQYEGVKFMWDACFESVSSIEAGLPGGGCILAHCMGLGKTLQVLALLHTVLTHPRAAMQRVLVCCPLSTVLNWVDEIHQWIGPVTDQIKVFELSKLKKTYERAYQLEDWYNGGGIFIIGYELFRSLTTLDPVLDDIRPTVVNKIRRALLDPGPDIIVCDEGHLLKNDCSVLAVAMSRVVTRRRIVLTGTPMQNNLREYYCMVNFVKPNLLGTYSEYSNRFENPIMNGQHRDSIDQDIKLMKARTHILHKVLEGCLQRQEASVLYPYLPKKHEYTVFIPLTKCQWDLYKHYLNVYANQSKQSVLKDFHILQKIWSHPQVLHFFQTKKRVETRNKLKVEKLEDDLAQEDLGSEDIKPSDTEWWLPYLEGGKMLDMLKSSNKFVAVFRILDECIKLGDKVLIFSTSLFCLDALESFLKKINKWSLGQEYYRLDGSVPAEVRQKWCREFNADHNHKTKLFLISTRAGCLGLNMTAANRVIILDTSWNPAHDIQSIFRVYRFGQKKDCFIYRLVALGTMEQKIYERSVTKQAVACRVVDEQQIDRHYNMAELTELYRFDEEGVGVPGGVAVGVQDVALLRVARDTALHAVHEHDSLLRGSTEQSLPEHERAAAWMQFQQEHAHKQMQNDIDADKEKHLKLMHENALNVLSQQNFEVKLENQQTPASVEPIPSVSDPKTKKGRKSSVVKCFIPIKTEIEQPQPGPSNVVQDVGNEEDMVKQITHILIKHNFQSRKGPSEISSLVNSVRKVVRSGQSSQLDMSDELTASIAKVLLQREGKTMPALTDVISEPTVIAGPSIMRTDIAPRKRGRPKRFKEEHDLPIETLIVPDESSSTEMDGRKKRKAALVAVKHLDSMAKDSVIELDDDDWKDNSDTDSASQPEDNYESTKAQLAKTDKSQLPAKKDITQSMSKNYEAPQPKNCAAPNVSFIENDSILLSDDDELSFITPEKTTVVEKPSTVTKPNTVEKPITVVEKPITVEKPAIVEKPATVEKSAAVEKPHRPGPASKKLAVKHKEAEKSVSEQVTPLHRSLLTNKNFIKIVAHTYLAGNPMLDEDAATLAAKYSTLKALKEVEASGKEIDSGPIYDIAVRVLGIDILKKLHKSNIPSKSSPQEMATTQHVQDKMLECQQVKMELANRFEPVQDKPLERSQPKVGVKKIADMRPNPVKQLPPIVQPGVPDVVPVGFFKRASNISSTETIQQPTGGECILPDDDDDVRIVSDPVPGPAMPANIVPVKPITVSRRNIKQPILLTRNHTATGEVAGGVPGDNYTPVSTAVPLPSRHIEISSGRVMVPQAPIKVTAGPRSQPPPSVAERTNDSTICLDSDEEESIVPHATMARPPQPGPVPVPVAMTTGGVLPQVVPMSLAAASPLPPRLLNSTPSACPLPAPTNNILYLKPNQKYLLPTTVNPLNQQNVQVAQSPLNMILQRKIYDNVIPAPVAPSPAPDTIVPMEAPRRLVPGKTMCKPGDILRVTKSGQIEVLTKCDDSVLPLIQSVQASEPAPAGVIEPVKPSPAQQDTSAVEAVPAQTVSDEEAQTRTPRKRIRVMSSSSSSSDSSRPSSPDDPLSILKDVVHIQAAYQPKIKPRVTTKKPEEVKAPEKPPQKKLLAAPATAKLSTPTTTKSSTLSNAKVTVKQNTMTVNTKEAKKPNRSTISVSQGSSKPTSTLNTTGVKNVENSNSLLKVRATQQQNTTADILNRVNRSLSSGSKTGRVDLSNQEQSSTIDLTDFIVTKQNTPMKQNTSAVMNKSTPAKCKTKVVMKPEKKSATTVVGTSKSLILDGKSITTTSKKLPSTVDLTGQKSIQITNVKMIQPGTSNKSIGDKKRLASDTSAPKKKKTEQMTLKDFNIDDIDDIIELE